MPLIEISELFNTRTGGCRSLLICAIEILEFLNVRDGRYGTVLICLMEISQYCSFGEANSEIFSIRNGIF